MEYNFSYFRKNLFCPNFIATFDQYTEIPPINCDM